MYDLGNVFQRLRRFRQHHLGTWENLPWGVFLVLQVSAVLKFFQLATSPSIGNLVLESKWLTFTIAVMEMLLGFWLISRFTPKRARLIGLVTFGIFFVSSVIKFIRGDSSCGCFGELSVPPIITILIDVIMIGLLFAWPANSRVMRPSYYLISLATVFTISAFLIVGSFSTSRITVAGSIEGEGRIVVISPDESWLGSDLPISQFVETKEFMTGEWRMVLYHHDCHYCQKVLMARAETPVDPNQRPTVFVEIPPYRAPTRNDSSHRIWRKLSGERNWFVKAPLVIHLSNGIVTEYQHYGAPVVN